MYPLDAINLETTVQLPKLESRVGQVAATKNVNFLDMLNRNDELYKSATEKVLKYASGENIAVHDVMVSMQNAKLSFQFAVQVRNKLIESYQEITRMQI
ncbi:flagellar hook-basal body complex protein FliE [Acinetobacter sp. 3657]|uniref:flagellar hook-basal body complex protein FliE n=1 Tax=Acinetobacter sp. 3657 TaxID=2817764 RepID=UPI00285E5396|nr:flagellar hook-basal body complex protein FliE [Prolinoborus sp. 3657]